MSIKLVLFDFDDTLYLKKTRCFINDFDYILTYIKDRNLDCIIVTCNYKIFQIMQREKPKSLQYIRDIIYVNAKSERKSDKVQPLLKYWKAEEIVFFDNDPYHVYDVSTNCNVRSFLVNPDYGIEFTILQYLLNSDIQTVKNIITCKIFSKTISFIDKYCKSQNLTELEKCIIN